MEYEDEYKCEGSVLSKELWIWSTRAQNLKLELAVVLVLQSEGRYWERHLNDIRTIAITILNTKNTLILAIC